MRVKLVRARKGKVSGTIQNLNVKSIAEERFIFLYFSPDQIPPAPDSPQRWDFNHEPCCSVFMP